MDILDDIPKEHPAVSGLKQIEAEHLEVLEIYQDQDTGMWYEVLDKPGAEGIWVESSCSHLFTYSYAMAIRMGIISKERYEAVLQKAYKGCIDALYYDEKGHLVVDYVCIGTCIDAGTYEHYISRACTKNDLHGMGAFVLMCTEMAKYNTGK